MPKQATEKENETPKPATPVTRLKERLRRWRADIIKVVGAVLVGICAMGVWLHPPLLSATFPHVTYSIHGKTYDDAQLYRVLSMPTRYYVQLPQKLPEGYHDWFVVDCRREVVAMMTNAPQPSVFGPRFIRRGSPLGLDLEFRKMDRSEWRIKFAEHAVVFSNTTVTVRLDSEK